MTYDELKQAITEIDSELDGFHGGEVRVVTPFGDVAVNYVTLDGNGHIYFYLTSRRQR